MERQEAVEPNRCGNRCARKTESLNPIPSKLVSSTHPVWSKQIGGMGRLPYSFFRGEKEFYVGYQRVKNDEALPVIMEPTEYDIRMKCPKCNYVIVNQGSVEALGPDFSADSALDSMVTDGFELHCDRCSEAFVGSIHSTYSETTFHIDGIDGKWPFWIKTV